MTALDREDGTGGDVGGITSAGSVGGLERKQFLLDLEEPALVRPGKMFSATSGG
jgi:hypothetical protein